MARPRARIGIRDLAVALAAVSLCAMPMLPLGFAADSVLDQPMSVTQRVSEAAGISMPIDGEFDLKRGGTTNGEITWRAWSTDAKGFKLTVRSDGVPAMRDTATGARIDDYSSKLKSWNVSGSDRRFGFTALGGSSLGAYDGGRQWRGFVGTRAIELARRREGATEPTDTTMLLRTEMGQALPSSAKPKAFIEGTVTVNL